MAYLTQGTGIIPISLPMESSKFIFWGLNPLIVFYFESCTLDDLIWKIPDEIQKEKAHQYLLKCTSTRGIASTEVTKVRKYIHTQGSVPCGFLYMMYRCRESYSMLLDTALHRQWLGGSFLSACIFLFPNLRAYLQECAQFVKIQDAAFLRPTPACGVLSFNHSF